jgi:hypothetical protein
MTVTRWYWLPAAVLALCGCGGNDGPSDNDRRLQAIQNAQGDLKSKGAKIEQRTYPIGQAYSVNLTGMQIDDKTLRQVQSLGNVSELNLSKTNLSDDHMGLINELKLCTLCLTIDLSHTAITDAGFQKLENLRFLSNLNLTGTKVSRAAVDAFKKKREGDPSVAEGFRKPTVRGG